MSDIQILVDMGFPKEKAERALQITNNKGVEPAMEWLLAHADEDEIPPPPPPAQQTEDTSASETNQNNDAPKEESEATTSNEQEVVKSLRCDDCNKLFKNQSEVEFHAAKTGHSNFSESTEEKKPLTEEERKAQLALIEEKLKQKRAEREERERQDALEREKLRIKSGKDLTEAKKRMEEVEMAKIIQQRKQEKADEKAARDRVRAQIEADKAARKAKLAAEQGKPIQSPASSTSTGANVISSQTASTTSSSNTPQKTYTNTRIQIRLHDGSTLTETFSVKEQLSAVRVFIQLRQNTDAPFGLMTSFPRKVFTDEDYEKPLEVLGLVPSAVLIVTKLH